MLSSIVKAAAVAVVAIAIGLVVYEDQLPAPYQHSVRIARTTVPVMLAMGKLPLGLRSESFDPRTRTLDYVIEHAAEGNATSVIDTIDEHGWSGYFMINVGPAKSEIVLAALEQRLEAALAEHRATGKTSFIALELGTFLGYGAVAIADAMKAFKAKHGLRDEDFTMEFLTVDPSPTAHAVSHKMLDYAGFGCDLSQYCTEEKVHIDVCLAYSGDVLRRVAAEGKKLDFVFVDHVKHLYLSDIELALELGVLADHAVVVGDNIIFPGAPDYKAFLIEGRGKDVFDTVVHDSTLEYSETHDQVTVSTLK